MAKALALAFAFAFAIVLKLQLLASVVFVGDALANINAVVFSTKTTGGGGESLKNPDPWFVPPLFQFEILPLKLQEKRYILIKFLGSI